TGWRNSRRGCSPGRRRRTRSRNSSASAPGLWPVSEPLAQDVVVNPGPWYTPAGSHSRSGGRTMIGRLCLALLLFTLSLPAADPPGPAADTPELKPLANLAGKWTSESTVKNEGQPAVMLKGTATGEWI